MRSRRGVLAGLLAAVAGCSEPLVTPTAEPTPTPGPTPTPIPAEIRDALRSTRFQTDPPDPPCPPHSSCSHATAHYDSFEVVMLPEDELVTPENPATTLVTHNVSDTAFAVASEPWIGKWTSIRWSPVIPIHDREPDTRTIDPGGTLERSFDIDGAADGIFAVVEDGYFVDEPDVEVRVGALVEVADSPWELTPDDDIAVEQDGTTVDVAPAAAGDELLVLAASDEDEGMPVVAETYAAYWRTKNALAQLLREDVERVRVPIEGHAWTYLREALTYPTDITEELAMRYADVIYTAHTEPRNR